MIAVLRPGRRSYTDRDLDESTLYFYRICGYNWAGDSDYSNIASATTPGHADEDGDEDDEDGDYEGMGEYDNM
jgi:hypothetical protein